MKLLEAVKRKKKDLSGSVRARYSSFIVYLKVKIAISLMQSESRFSSKTDNENRVSKNSERYLKSMPYERVNWVRDLGYDY